MKIISTKTIVAVHECHLTFGLHPVREQVYKRTIKFLTNYKYNANLILSAFEQQASCEIPAACLRVEIRLCDYIIKIK